MALSLAEARLQVAVDSIEVAKGRNDLLEASRESESGNEGGGEESKPSSKEEEEFFAAQDDIRACRATLENCEGELRRLQSRKEELQKEVDRLNGVAEKAQMNALKAKEDVANIMLLAEQAVAFEIEAAQSVSDAEIALQRAESSLSISHVDDTETIVHQNGSSSQGQVLSEEELVDEGKANQGDLGDTVVEMEREVPIEGALIIEPLPGIQLDGSGQNFEEPTLFNDSDQENGRLSFESSRDNDIDSEKTKNVAQTKKQELQKDLPRDSSPLNAPKALLKKSSRFFSTSFFSLEGSEFTPVSLFNGLIESARKELPKLIVGSLLVGAGLVKDHLHEDLFYKRTPSPLEVYHRETPPPSQLLFYHNSLAPSVGTTVLTHGCSPRRRCSPRPRFSPRPKGSKVFTSPIGLTGVHLAKGVHLAQRAQKSRSTKRIITNPQCHNLVKDHLHEDLVVAGVLPRILHLLPRSFHQRWYIARLCLKLLNLGWRLMLEITAVPAVFLAAGVLAMPESPRWLVLQAWPKAGPTTRRRRESPRQNLRFQKLALLHLADIKVAAGNLPECNDDAVAVPKRNWRELLHPTPTVRHILIAGVGIQFFQRTSGIDAVILYSPKIFEKVGLTSQSHKLLATVAVGFVKTTFILVATFLLDRIGRRPLLLSSVGGMIVSLASLGIALTIIDHSDTKLIWAIALAIASVLAYVATFSIGMGPITLVYSSEILPLHLRARGTSIVLIVNRVMSGIISMTFLSFSKAITIGGVFFFFTGVSIAGFVFFNTLLPETQGKTLEEIQVLFGTFLKWRSTMRELEKNNRMDGESNGYTNSNSQIQLGLLMAK
ncbi:polyol/monosaccharide transporter 5 [Actinidia rufa]|uniref:Polyol/monosaccharide transporter 5 n=1 Tax=Actinidia rufa TaxID=165716 RepID=A0A7J0EUB6_9ERIC|nr:polyol/monosaccharide transporter 5 [Actinidia rufa]